MSAAATLARIALVAVIMVAAYVVPPREAPSTHAAFHAADDAAGTFRATIPSERECVLWARATGEKDTLHVSGAGNLIRGCVHSNGDALLTGADTVVEGAARYATELRIGGARLEGGAEQVAPAPPPYAFPRERILAREDAVRIAGDATLDAAELAAGLYIVEGNATLRANGGSHRISVVATGRVHVDAQETHLRAYAEGVVVAGEAVHFAGRAADVRGALVAWRGAVHLAGEEHTLLGHVVGETVAVSARRATLTAENPAAV